MAKIYFNTRDDLIAVDVDDVVVIAAEGNYTHITTRFKKEIMLTMGIGKVEEALNEVKTKKSRFVRINRSLIVNHSMLHRIDVVKHLLTLSDGEREIRLNVNKNALKNYKLLITKKIKIKSYEKDHIGARR